MIRIRTLSGLMKAHWSRGARHKGSDRRAFLQKLNEAHLSATLEDIATVARGGEAVDPVPFAKTTTRQSPRTKSMWDTANGAPSIAPGEFNSFAAANFVRRQRKQPWQQYESMRMGPAGAGSGNPRWQDLTHAESRRMQEMHMRKKMLDSKLLFMKQQHLPNPERDAKQQLRDIDKKEEAEKQIGDLYPPPFMEERAQTGRDRGMETRARRDELVSKLRNRIRQERLENAKLLKKKSPSVGSKLTDAIQRHVQRRLVRQRSGITAKLEDCLMRNTAQIQQEFLKGVSISVARVTAKKPRATQNVYYHLLSDHDPAWVQKQLDILAPRIRSDLALRLNMGMTPVIRFKSEATARHMNRERLWPVAEIIKAQAVPGTPSSGVRPSVGEVKSWHKRKR